MKSDKDLTQTIIFAALCAATALLSSTAFSNDSIAHLEAGGLILAQSADIEMQSEDLYISFDKIKVQYRFWNKSDHDVETIVAFPMPDLKPMLEGNDYSVPTEFPENFLAFETSVNGVPVKAKVEQKIYAVGIDRTDDLQRLSIPLAPHLEITSKALDQLKTPDQEKLLSLGLARRYIWDVGLGIEENLQPNWTLRTTYYWSQIFPSGKPIKVTHEYQPSIGASASSMIGMEGTALSSESQLVKDYCIDESFFKAARKVQSRLAVDGKYLTEKRLEYVLETGANWSGPIRDFRLVVDKGSTKNLVSFCGTDLKKISPTQFEMRKRNYWPSQNLNVLLLEPAG